MTDQKRIDQFANRIAARLEGGGVPHDVSERLRCARRQALAARKAVPLAALQAAPASAAFEAALAASGPGSGGQLPDRPDTPGWLGWLAPLLALAALLAGCASRSSFCGPARAWPKPMPIWWPMPCRRAPMPIGAFCNICA